MATHIHVHMKKKARDSELYKGFNIEQTWATAYPGQYLAKNVKEGGYMGPCKTIAALKQLIDKRLASIAAMKAKDEEFFPTAAEAVQALKNYPAGGRKVDFCPVTKMYYLKDCSVQDSLTWKEVARSTFNTLLIGKVYLFDGKKGRVKAKAEGKGNPLVQVEWLDAARDADTVYKGYIIRNNPITGDWFVLKDGHTVCRPKNLEDAKHQIDQIA